MAGRSSSPADGSAASGSPPRPDRRKPARLKRRREFLAAAKARRWTTPGFVLQARLRAREEFCETDGARIGFTASKKVGGAVARNRAKRRLSALVDAVAPDRAQDGWDYVLIARRGATASREFAAMRVELETAFERVHAPRKPRDDAKTDRRVSRSDKPDSARS